MENLKQQSRSVLTGNHVIAMLSLSRVVEELCNMGKSHVSRLRKRKGNSSRGGRGCTGNWGVNKNEQDDGVWEKESWKTCRQGKSKAGKEKSVHYDCSAEWKGAGGWEVKWRVSPESMTNDFASRVKGLAISPEDHRGPSKCSKQSRNRIHLPFRKVIPTANWRKIGLVGDNPGGQKTI